MREAFESREVSALQNVASTMDEEVSPLLLKFLKFFHERIQHSKKNPTIFSQVFSYHMKRCIDSGLWVPGGGEEGEGEDGPEEEASAKPSTSNC